MSGNAFKQTERMSTETLESLKGLLLNLSRQGHFHLSKPHYPEYFSDKVDHGDLDVFLSDTTANRSAVNEIAMTSYRNTVEKERWVDMTVFAKHNSTVQPSERFIIQTEGGSQLRMLSSEGKWCQVDVQFVPSDCIQFSAHYYSYGDLSQLLQIWLRKYKMVLKNTGLYYKTVTEGVEHLVRITTDWFAVLDLLELSHRPYQGYNFSSYRDAFIWMERSYQFKPEMVALLDKDHRADRPMFKAISEHKFDEFTYKRFTTVDITHKVLERLPEAFVAIALAKINDLANSSTDKKYYALSHLLTVGQHKSTNYGSMTNLSIFDSEGYMKLVKSNDLPF